MTVFDDGQDRRLNAIGKGLSDAGRLHHRTIVVDILDLVGDGEGNVAAITAQDLRQQTLKRRAAAAALEYSGKAPPCRPGPALSPLAASVRACTQLRHHFVARHLHIRSFIAQCFEGLIGI